jgi:hypothetical protein
VRGAAIAPSPTVNDANEDVMANEDRRCAFCGEKIVWNEEFSMENGKEYHVAPRRCWTEYLKSDAHKMRDSEEASNETKLE